MVSSREFPGLKQFCEDVSKTGRTSDVLQQLNFAKIEHCDRTADKTMSKIYTPIPLSPRLALQFLTLHQRNQILQHF